MPRRVVVPFVCLLTVLLVGPSLAEACPTCKEGLAGAGDGHDLARGYYWSILFMMSMPFLILGGLAGYFYFEIRRARQTAPLADVPPARATCGKASTTMTSRASHE
jgi:hypothetical protein